MAIHITTWHPDTCKCVLEYSWDDSVPEGARVHSPHKVVSCCEIHSALSPLAAEDATTHHALIVEENTRKNLARKNVLESLPRNLKKSDDEFKDGEEPAWSFDEDRNLVMELHPSHKSFAEVTTTKMVAEPTLDDKRVSLK